MANYTVSNVQVALSGAAGVTITCHVDANFPPQGPGPAEGLTNIRASSAIGLNGAFTQAQGHALGDYTFTGTATGVGQVSIVDADMANQLLSFAVVSDPPPTISNLNLVRTGNNVVISGVVNCRHNKGLAVRFVSGQCTATFTNVTTTTSTNGAGTFSISQTVGGSEQGNEYLYATDGFGQAGPSALVVLPLSDTGYAIAFDPPVWGVGNLVTLAATVTNSAGSPAPNGTAVAFIGLEVLGATNAPYGISNGRKALAVAGGAGKVTFEFPAQAIGFNVGAYIISGAVDVLVAEMTLTDYPAPSFSAFTVDRSDGASGTVAVRWKDGLTVKFTSQPGAVRDYNGLKAPPTDADGDFELDRPIAKRRSGRVDASVTDNWGRVATTYYIVPKFPHTHIQLNTPTLSFVNPPAGTNATVTITGTVFTTSFPQGTFANAEVKLFLYFTNLGILPATLTTDANGTFSYSLPIAMLGHVWAKTPSGPYEYLDNQDLWAKTRIVDIEDPEPVIQDESLVKEDATTWRFSGYVNCAKPGGLTVTFDGQGQFAGQTTTTQVINPDPRGYFTLTKGGHQVTEWGAVGAVAKDVWGQKSKRVRGFVQNTPPTLTVAASATLVPGSPGFVRIKGDVRDANGTLVPNTTITLTGAVPTSNAAATTGTFDRTIPISSLDTINVKAVSGSEWGQTDCTPVDTPPMIVYLSAVSGAGNGANLTSKANLKINGYVKCLYLDGLKALIIITPKNGDNATGGFATVADAPAGEKVFTYEALIDAKTAGSVQVVAEDRWGQKHQRVCSFNALVK